MLLNFIAILIQQSMSLCVNHLGKNNTRLTLKQQLVLTSENQTANAREPENNSLKTDESNF
tara:strand:- start:455 stop:637 length:183 start_codon:yes stop_codon:yes gene_type:complete